MRPICRPKRIGLGLGLLEGVLGLGRALITPIVSYPWRQTTAYYQPREMRLSSECWGALLTKPIDSSSPYW